MANRGAFTDAWLLGSNGLYAGTPDTGWERIGNYGFPVNAILRTQAGAIVGTGNGLWQMPSTEARWVQLHDETLTEVMDLAGVEGDPGVIAAFAYGIGIGRRDDIGSCRWTSVTSHLPVNRRHSNVLRVDPGDGERWVTGTEDGVIVGSRGGTEWETSDLTGTAVRGLCVAQGSWWAATDTRGVWRSEDGLAWSPAGGGLEGRAAFCVVGSEDRILVGTDAGVALGDGSGVWQACGPRIRVRALCVHPADPATWLAGGDPGGLWVTRDLGATWRASAGFSSIRAISPAKEG